MSTQDPPVSSGARSRLWFGLGTLVVTSLAAGLVGLALGNQLMASLREQVEPFRDTTEDIDALAEDYSPYDIENRPDGDTLLADASGEGLPPGEADEPQDGAALNAAEAEEGETVLEDPPEIAMEPLNMSGEVLETVPAAEEGEGTIEETPDPAAPPEDRETIFSLGEEEPRNTVIYRINLGSFMSHENAATLIDELGDHDYRAFVEESESPEGQPIYRVLIGNYQDSASASSAAEELRGLGYNAWVNKK